MTDLWEARQGAFQQLKKIAIAHLQFSVEIGLALDSIEQHSIAPEIVFARCLTQTRTHAQTCTEQIEVLSAQLGLPIRAPAYANGLTFLAFLATIQKQLQIVQNSAIAWREMVEEREPHARAEPRQIPSIITDLFDQTTPFASHGEAGLFAIAEALKTKPEFMEWHAQKARQLHSAVASRPEHN